MGVHGLEHYLDQSEKPNKFCYEVNIQELAQEYTTRKKKKPVIVVDGPNSLRNRLRGSNEITSWLLGGQMKEFVQEVQKFVSSFQNIGVDLVFFFNGATPENNRQNWIYRRNNNIRKVNDIFKATEEMNKKSLKDLYLLPPLIGGTARFATNFEGGCKTFISLEDDDLEIAEYARKNDCFAILSQDSDFLFHKGDWHYLSLKHLDLETMHTIKYDKNELKEDLTLRTDHEMLLLATLLGNDVITSKTLAEYHNKIVPHSAGKYKLAGKLIPKIVHYIKEQNFYNCSIGNLSKVSFDIFGTKDKAEEIQKSIFSYTGEGEQTKSEIGSSDSMLQEARKRHMNGELTTHMYPVMIGHAYELSTALEEYGINNDTTADIYLPLRKRIYAIILQEIPHIRKVKEWCVSGGRYLHRPNVIDFQRISNLGHVHPGYLSLWNEACSSDTKWRLFVEGLTQGRKLDLSGLKQLGLPYAVPVAVLFYLNEEGKGLLDMDEVVAIFSHVAALQHYKAPDLERIDIDLQDPKVQYHLKTFISFSTIYHRGITTVLFLLSACGFSLKQAMPWHYYDGKLLFRKYMQRQREDLTIKGLCENEADAYKLCRQMMDLIPYGS